MNIKILKLLNGEDLIGDVSFTDDHYNIKNPLRVVVIPSRTDPKTPQVGLAPWNEFATDKAFTINQFHVVTIMTPVPEFVNQYKSIFGGIVTPQTSLIMP